MDKLKSSKNQRTLEDDDYERLSYTDYLNGTIPIAGHPINGFYSYKFKGLDPTDGRPMFYGTEEENKEAYGKLTKEQLYKTVMEYSGCRNLFSKEVYPVPCNGDVLYFHSISVTVSGQKPDL